MANKSDKAAKGGKGKGRSDSADTTAKTKSDRRKRSRSRNRTSENQAQAPDDAADATALAPTAQPSWAKGLDPPMPADAEGRIRCPFGEKGGKFAWAAHPDSAVGLFCPTCGEHHLYDQICHRMCIFCKTQFPIELQSWKMRNLPHRPDMGDTEVPKPPKPPNPNSAEGTLAAGPGNRPAATIAAAAAVVAIDTVHEKAKAGRKTLQGGGKVTKDEENSNKKEALRAEWYKWKTIHSEDTAHGAPADEVHLDHLERAKRAFIAFDKEWKSDDKDKGETMVAAAEAFSNPNE